METDYQKEILEKTMQFQDKYQEYRKISDEYDESKDNISIKDSYVRCFRELKKIVRELEILRQEYDASIGFNIAQQLTHDLVFKFKTDRKGQISAELYSDQLKSIYSILNIVHPGATNIADFEILGIAAGSGMALANFVPKTAVAENPERVAETLSQLNQAITASISFAEAKGSPEQKLEVFQKETGLDKETSVQVIASVAKTIPSKGEENPVMELTVGQGPSGIAKIYEYTDDKLRTLFSKASKDAKALVKKPDPLIISGQLRQLEAWEEVHKFVIYDYDEKKQYTIYYEPTSENLRIIKDKISHVVTIERTKFERKWALKRWIED